MEELHIYMYIYLSITISDTALQSQIYSHGKRLEGERQTIPAYLYSCYTDYIFSFVSNVSLCSKMMVFASLFTHIYLHDETTLCITKYKN